VELMWWYRGTRSFLLIL